MLGDTLYPRKFTRRTAFVTFLCCASFLRAVDVGVDFGLNEGLINLREELLTFRRLSKGIIMIYGHVFSFIKC